MPVPAPRWNSAVALGPICRVTSSALPWKPPSAITTAGAREARLAAVLRSGDAHDPATVFHDFRRDDAAQQPALPPGEVRRQRAQQHVRPAALPLQSRCARAGRGQHPAHPFIGARLDELRTLAADPGERALRLVGEQMRQRRLGQSAGRALDRLVDRVRARRHVLEGEVDEAAGIARIAGIELVRAALQHDRAQTQLRSAISGAQARQSAADDNEIVVHPSVPISAAACR